MGMFDNIRCDIPLPDAFIGELQTKDFDCTMVTHVITANGRLMIERGHMEEVPKAERPHPDAPDDSFKSFRGCLRLVSNLVDSEFHGILNFYGTDRDGGWHEYDAKFTDGQLVSIAVVPDIEDASERGGGE